MASRVPIVRQLSLGAFALHLVLLSALVWLGSLLFPESRPEWPILFGAIIFFVAGLLLRNTLARHHRRGVRFMRRGRFKEAIGSFEASVAFFSRRPWMDRWRVISLLSASRASYREMGLCNLAFAFAQSGDGGRSKETYKRALAEYPNSALAATALRLIESVEANRT